MNTFREQSKAPVRLADTGAQFLKLYRSGSGAKSLLLESGSGSAIEKAFRIPLELALFQQPGSIGVQPNMAEALSRILRVQSPEILFERLHLVFETKFNFL